MYCHPILLTATKSRTSKPKSRPWLKQGRNCHDIVHVVVHDGRVEVSTILQRILEFIEAKCPRSPMTLFEEYQVSPIATLDDFFAPLAELFYRSHGHFEIL
jgi:hypothetical protein